MRRGRITNLPAPYLRRLWIDPDFDGGGTVYPFNLPCFRDPDFELVFDLAITIIVGENGVGKSTLLEAIAALVGFDEAGGGVGYMPVDHSRAHERGGRDLTRRMKASWLPKIHQGWFFRAESFFSVARYLDEAAFDSGGVSPDFLSHSHGEGFLRFFEERCRRPGIFLFDEPESALSPRRQFDFLKVLTAMQQGGKSQAIIATHSPILMALPGARLLGMTGAGLAPIRLEDTPHYRIYREFILDPAGTVRAMIED